MAQTSERAVVVGAGLAALRGAEAMREAGFAGPLTIVGAEPCRPYDRPPLSKHVLDRRHPGGRHHPAEQPSVPTWTGSSAAPPSASTGWPARSGSRTAAPFPTTAC